MLRFMLAMIQREPTISSITIRTERQREHVVFFVRSGGDGDEEDEVHADLGDRQHRERDPDAGLPDERRPGNEERHDRDHSRQEETDHIA